MRQVKCAVEGCENPHRAKRYCTVHYQRAKRHGDPRKKAAKGRGPAFPPEKREAIKAWVNAVDAMPSTADVAKQLGLTPRQVAMCAARYRALLRMYKIPPG